MAKTSRQFIVPIMKKLDKITFSSSSCNGLSFFRLKTLNAIVGLFLLDYYQQPLCSHLFSWLRLICYTNQWSIPTLSMLGSHPTPSSMKIKLKLSHLCNSKRENKNRPSPDYLVRQVAWPALLLGQPRVKLRTENCQKTYNLFSWTSVQ